jgi:UDP-N-acetylmuramate-alanine ligase
VTAFGEDLGDFSLGVPGHHMVLNALAAPSAWPWNWAWSGR